MDSSLTAATGRVMLRLKPEDPKQPDAGRRAEFTSYQLRFTDANQRENRRPVRYRIEVDADQRPKVRFVTPTEAEVQLLANDSLEMKVAAEDDFGLRRVAIMAEVRGQNRASRCPSRRSWMSPPRRRPRPGRSRSPISSGRRTGSSRGRAGHLLGRSPRQQGGGRPARLPKGRDRETGDRHRRPGAPAAAPGGRPGRRQSPEPRPQAERFADQSPQPAEPTPNRRQHPTKRPNSRSPAKTDASPPSAAEKPKPPGQESGPSQANQKEQPGGAGQVRQRRVVSPRRSARTGSEARLSSGQARGGDPRRDQPRRRDG